MSKNVDLSYVFFHIHKKGSVFTPYDIDARSDRLAVRLTDFQLFISFMSEN